MLLKTPLQLPVPPASVIVQSRFAPFIMVTMPVGVPPSPVTVTVIGTGWPTVNEKAAAGEVMVVVVGPGVTVWLSVSEPVV